MPGWLKTALGWTIGGLQDLWNKAIALITAVYTYVDSRWDALWSEVVSLYNGLTAFVDAIEEWVSSLYNYVLAWIVTHIAEVVSWAQAQLASLSQWVKDVIQWASSLIDALRALVSSWISGLENWVIQNIWAPLARYLNDALGWITNEGYLVYYYITHPDALAGLLGHYLLGSWLTLVRRYGGMFVLWTLHNSLKLASPIGTLIEDIIASII